MYVFSHLHDMLAFQNMSVRGRKLSFFVSFSPSVSVYLCFSVCLSVCISVSPSVCLSVCFSVCLSVCLPVCLAVCDSLSLSLSLFLSLTMSPYSFMPSQKVYSPRSAARLCLWMYSRLPSKITRLQKFTIYCMSQITRWIKSQFIERPNLHAWINS